MSKRMEDLLSGETGRAVFPFFWLRGEEEDTLRKYMHVIHDAGCRAVCLESRPHPDFCGPRWWHDLDILLEEAKKLDMKLWILDDSHFPTGYCNGALRSSMEKGDYTLLRQSVTSRVLLECRGGETVSLSGPDYRLPPEQVPTAADTYFMKPFPRFADDRLLDVTAVRLDQAEQVSLGCGEHGEIRWTAPDGQWRIYGVYLTRNRGPHRDYMNMLSVPSCRTLIDAVYEPHFRHYGHEFGKTILGFFSDEPELGNGHIYQLDRRLHETEDLPWSDEVRAALENLWGSAWTTRLPLLWDTDADADQAAQVRCQYMDTVTRLVRQDFSCQIGDWCRAHGVRYIGHLIEDQGQHTRCVSSLGHYFRGLAGQDMAGIDDIGGQVLPQGEDLDIRTKWQEHRDGTFYHFALGTLAASAAAIEPGKHGDALCEIFGNYGWAEGVNLEKYLAEHFMVRGINHFVPHAFSAAPFPDRDCPPHFYAHGNNPQYRHFGFLVRYMERVCHLISGGHTDAPVAVLYHAEADWAGGTCQSCECVGRVLAEHQIGYHFLPADVFSEPERYHTRMQPEDRCLRVHQQDYRMLIIPEAAYLSSHVLDGIREMKKSGIPVLFTGSLPRGFCTEKGETVCPPDPADVFTVCSMQELESRCEKGWLSHVQCTPASRMIRCLHYIGEDYELYYCVNESSETYTGTVRFQGSFLRAHCVYRYDAWDNCCYAVSMDDDSRFPVVWEPRKSYLYVFDKSYLPPEELREERPVSGAVILPLKHWTRSVCRAAEYPAFGMPSPVVLPDAYEKEDPSFGGFIRYETTFAPNPVSDRLELVIPGLQEGIEVFVNGVRAGVQVAGNYRFDITGLLRVGCNKLVIEQATTLERVVPRVDSVSREPVVPGNHLGIDTVPFLAVFP